MTYIQKVSALALKTQCFFQSSNGNSTAAEKNERNEDVGYFFCNHLSTFSAIQELEFVWKKVETHA